MNLLQTSKKLNSRIACHFPRFSENNYNPIFLDRLLNKTSAGLLSDSAHRLIEQATKMDESNNNPLTRMVSQYNFYQQHTIYKAVFNGKPLELFTGINETDLSNGYCSVCNSRSECSHCRPTSIIKPEQ